MFFKHLQTYCRVVKLADTPPCLGGGEFRKYWFWYQLLHEGSTPSPTAIKLY